jgi:hypothetical protein
MALSALSGLRRCGLILPSFRPLHLPHASASPYRAFSHHRILSPSDTAAYLACSLLPSSRSPAPPRSVSTARHTLVQTRPPWTGPCATTCSLRLQLTSLAALLRSPLLPFTPLFNLASASAPSFFGELRRATSLAHHPEARPRPCILPHCARSCNRSHLTVLACSHRRERTAHQVYMAEQRARKRDTETPAAL